MPRADGVYSLPSGSTVTASTTIESAKYNAVLADLVQDANTARPVVAGGTGATSASAARTALSAAALGANTDITSVYLNNTGLKVKDTNASHGLSIVPGSDLSADRVLTITTGDAARTLDISAGSVTITAAGGAILDDADAGAQRTTLSAAARAQTDFISGVIAGGLSDRDWRLVINLPYAITVTKTTTRSVSGTATATFKINTTALGGTANSVSSTEQEQAHASANAVAIGDDIVVTISSNSSCIDMSFTIEFTRTLA